MAAISFKLETFEGPLDLLLHLVSKHKLNIYDIEISLLLEQYLDYMSKIETQDYEQAADFLEMAARLIYIKTCYLLPKPEEAEELKKELEGRMIEYSLCRLTAQKLRERYAGGSIFVRQAVKLPVNKTYSRTHDVAELYNAYMAISTKAREYHPLRANVFSPIVAHKIISVESKITQILELLYTTGGFKMSELYEGMSSRSERIAAFLAVLELTKSGRIALNDDNTEVTLRRDYDPDAEEDGGGEIAPETQETEPAEEPEKPTEAAIEAIPAVAIISEAQEAEPIEEAEAPTAAPVEQETEPADEPIIIAEPRSEARQRPQSASLAISAHRLMMTEPLAVADLAHKLAEQDKPPAPTQPELTPEISEAQEPAEAPDAPKECEMIPDIPRERETEPPQEPSRLPEDTGYTLKPNLWAERWYWGRHRDRGLRLNTKTRIDL